VEGGGATEVLVEHLKKDLCPGCVGLLLGELCTGMGYAAKRALFERVLAPVAGPQNRG
jgi:hypothetical protein